MRLTWHLFRSSWLVAILVLLAFPLTARALEVGIADSDGDTFSDPAWAGLTVGKGRAVVPYDVALTDPSDTGEAGKRRRNFDAWVGGARAAGVEPLVAFEPSSDPAKRTLSGEPAAPTATQFADAMRAFLRQYPSVRKLAAWNEPNFRNSGNPLATQPALAAELYLTLDSVCRAEGAGCTIAAGDFAGIPGDDAYVDSYQAALGTSRPEVWSFHAHSDINRFQAGSDQTAPVTRYYLSKLGGSWGEARIWIDEVGAYYRDALGKVWGDDSQREATSFVLGLARLSTRIDRIYYYNLSNQCSTASRCAVQDRGLVAPSPWDSTPLSYDEAGRRRGAYAVIRDRGPVIAPTPVPPTVKAYDAAGFGPTIGSVYKGRDSLSRLGSDDGSLVEYNAVSSEGMYVSEIQPWTTITSAERAALKRLTINFDGGVSSTSVVHTVSVQNQATGQWEAFLGPVSGTTNDRSATFTTSTSPADYVSAGGTIRIRARGTHRKSSWRTGTDWVRFTIEY